MTWPVVVFALGLVTLAVVVYAVRSLVVARSNAAELRDLRVSVDVANGGVSALLTRLGRVETALHMDGKKLAAEAQRNALPAIMK